MNPIDKRILTGSIAILKVNNVVIGKCRDIRINETYRRVPVSQGIGHIYDDELAVVKFQGSVTVDFFEISFNASGFTDALKRSLFSGSNMASNIATGNAAPNFEDQLVLDDVGIAMDIYKKISDIQYSGTGLIIPNKGLYCSISHLFIEGDSINISDGGISGRNQTFGYLSPVVIA